MAEGNSSGEFNKSRSVLGDLTNLPRKRGGFPEIDNCGSRSSNLSGKETAKRIRVSSVQCIEDNPLKDTFESSISKVPNENREANVLGFGSTAVPKSVIASETERSDGRCLKEVNAIFRDLKAIGGNNDVAVSNRGEGAAVSKAVKGLCGDNNFVNCQDKIGITGDDALNEDKLCGRDCKDPNFGDFERGRAVDSVAEAELELTRSSDVCVAKGNEVKVTSTGGGKVAFGTKIDPSFTDHVRKDALEHGNVGAGDELGYSFPADTSRTVSETGGDGEDFDADDYLQDVDDHNADSFILSHCSSIDGMFVPESQESRVFGVEGSTEPKKVDECAHVSEGTDSIKSCSCSFCSRAAYMWLDLNYQDIKARVSAMKKTQKEASILAERSVRSKATEKCVAETSTSVSNLESDLMHQWRSLFQHMANLLDEEGKELEARLLPLTDLREKYKANSESTNAALAEKK